MPPLHTEMDPNGNAPGNELTPILREIISISQAAYTLDADISSLEGEARKQDDELSLIARETRASCEGAESVAALAGEISQTSARAKEIASEGIESQNRFLEEFKALRTIFGETDVFMTDLKKRSDDIKRLSEIIEDIGDQLNILSINASIEAARAGSAGKGFAVIAKEMRKMYSKVDDSAAEVGTLIKAVIFGIATSTDSLEKAKKTLADSMTNAERTERGLAELGDINAELSVKTAEISTRTSDQIGRNDTIDAIATRIGVGSSAIRKHTEISRENAQRVHAAVDQTLISMSKFHFSWQKRAEAGMRDLAGTLSRENQKSTLAKGFRNYPWFELFYIMDETGVQISDNIENPSIKFADDGSRAKGASRRTKAYFTKAVAEPGRCIFSDFYVSSATENLCVTISQSYTFDSHTFVLAGDINLDGILSITP